LREHNDALKDDANKAGFYGLDLYSLHASIEAVLDYLKKLIPTRQSVRVIATPVSITLARTLRLMVTRPASI